MSVLTRWHRLRDATTGPSMSLAVDEKVARPVSELPGTFGRAAFESFLDEAGSCPRFVIPRQVAEMTVTRPAMQSLSDMHVCGVVGLPFPACVVEYDAGIDRFHIHLGEVEDPAGGGRRWVGTPVASYRDGSTEVAVAYPASVAFRLGEEPGGDPDNPDVRFAYQAVLAPYLAPGEPSEGFAQATGALAFRRVAIGFMAALLLHATTGLRHERVRVPPALNRARGRGRHPIPDHTVIRLESYATADGGSRKFDERAPAEVHLRRAHKRRVAHGAGRTERRWRLIPAQVVGYLPDGRKPGVAELLASRAARPYRVSAPGARAGSARDEAGKGGLVGREAVPGLAIPGEAEHP